MNRIITTIENVVLYVLMGLMALVLIVATVDLIWTVIKELTTPPLFLFTLETLLEIFGMFLLVLVGLELLDTIKAYVKEHVVHAEIVILAAMIAVARKVITLDIKTLDPMMPVALGAVLLSLGVAYFLIKHTGVAILNKKHPADSPSDQ